MKIEKPTIEDFSNANHDHSNIEEGGLLSGWYLPYSGAVDDVYLGNHQIIPTISGYVGRDEDELSSEIHLGNGRVITITRTDDLISSFTDGTRTWNIMRNTSDLIEGWTVT